MRVHSRSKTADESLRRQVLRLDHLPLRPQTARRLIQALPEVPVEDDVETLESPKIRAMCGLDPGWVLDCARAGDPPHPLECLAGRPWWPRAVASGPVAELLDRLWRHSVAVGRGAYRLARDAGDPDPDAVARAGQLAGLGFWAVAAIEPEWLLAWWREPDPTRRQEKERADLGSDLPDLGRRLAERWGCDPMVADAAWLHADGGGALNAAAIQPARLVHIQLAYRWAEQMPWSFPMARPWESHGSEFRAPTARDHEVAPSEPRIRVLMAEVQARCAGPFVDPEATPHEERMTRQNARLRLDLGALRRTRERGERFVQLLAESPPAEPPEDWAARAALSWCGEPGVTAARVLWHGAEPPDSYEAATATANPTGDPQATAPRAPAAPSAGLGWSVPGLPARLLALGEPGRAPATVQLWSGGDGVPEPGLSAATVLRAWEVWAAILADRARLEGRLQAMVRSFRSQVQSEEERLRRGQLDAMAEFAAGAGHELNNPLAVIVGRAQLLLARVADPEIARSLRIILNQAQRTHRILRDLMFVARPPASRDRLCRPSEWLGALLREFERDCASKGIVLVSELEDPAAPVRADPEALRHLTEILLRNALQATAPGGKIHVRSCQKSDELVWSVSDTGKGILPGEAPHLFDPFFCGRQAGRGLGLGLPRAARIVDRAGGRLRWSSHPGHETTFQISLPLTPDLAPGGSARPAARVPSLLGEPLLKT